MRLDHQERPELNKGTVDFEVPEAYWASNPPAPFDPNSPTKPQETPRQPQPIDRIFAFDVSHNAVQSGLLYTSAMAVRRILFGEQTDDQAWIQPSINPESRIAIMTYDSSIHFYNLSVRWCCTVSDWFCLIPFLHDVARTSIDDCYGGY
jgi:protein transport protein SEC24